MERTDAEIVKASLLDPDAFGGIVERYEAKLYRYIRRCSNFSHEEIEEVLQETFINVYRYLNKFNEKLAFSSWIYRIAHNQMISAVRKKKARPKYVFGDEDFDILNTIPDDIDIEKDVAGTFDREVIEGALQELNEKYRDVIILQYFEERTYQEISDILKIPVRTVGTRLNRGKKQLKELLASRI